MHKSLSLGLNESLVEYVTEFVARPSGYPFTNQLIDTQQTGWLQLDILPHLFPTYQQKWLNKSNRGIQDPTAINSLKKFEKKNKNWKWLMARGASMIAFGSTLNS